MSNCNFSSFWCCLSADPAIEFRHSNIESAGDLLWTDVFIQVDRTTILDNDYLKITKSGETISPETKKYKIVRDQGNTSGVTRVYLPAEAGSYDIYYIRDLKYRARVFGKHLIKISPILISSFQDLKYEKEIKRQQYPNHLQVLFKKSGSLFTVPEASSPGRDESLKSSINPSRVGTEEYPFEITPKNSMYNKLTLL
ncbi:unnamed protein product [Blepharisma stoltei]|uniref:Uncharacterized protein n=1 Tax=Blepharisma stoltei TaxID=1481888 RepID=A0AAU9ILK3_9CILI|nr:unnamed protein product [Blepharisma stoltei]